MEPVERYWKKLVQVCINRKLSMHPLGRTGKQFVWMIRNDVPGNKILITAGFHGDEVAGPLGILRFLETADNDLLFSCGLTVIPIVNPVAFRKRHNNRTRSNCGFILGMFDKLSIEGKVLEKNMNLLRDCSRNGFLSLHETTDEIRFSLYAYTHPFILYAVEKILEEGKKYFLPICFISE